MTESEESEFLCKTGQGKHRSGEIIMSMGKDDVPTCFQDFFLHLAMMKII